MAITFQNQDIVFRLTSKMKVKSWIRKILKKEGKKEGQINIVFTHDDRLHEMNLQYLSHDTLTDIITFDESEGLVLNGDIVISRDRVEENAEKYATEFDRELRRVMVHGVLHLCGYKDKSEEEKRVMRAKEDEALALFETLN